MFVFFFVGMPGSIWEYFKRLMLAKIGLDQEQDSGQKNLFGTLLFLFDLKLNVKCKYSKDKLINYN